MKYTVEDLFSFMDARRPVKVTCKDGKVFTGMCWAYSSGYNLEENGVDEPSIEVWDTLIYLSEIEKIEYAE